MKNRKGLLIRSIRWSAGMAIIWIAMTGLLCGADGVYVRFKLTKPADATYSIGLSGNIHNDPWHFPGARLPAAGKPGGPTAFKSGEFTPWHDLKAQAGAHLHGRKQRAGGIAEFPSVVAQFAFTPAPKAENGPAVAVIELATAPDEQHIVKRFEETLDRNMTAFLISPNLARDKDDLETLSQMEARHIAWAKAASGGKRVSPKPENHILQTSFWVATPTGADVLSLLGFNMVGGLPPNLFEKHPELGRTAHAGFYVNYGPTATQEQVDGFVSKQVKTYADLPPGTPVNFSDEIVAPAITSTNQAMTDAALKNFRTWLAQQKIPPSDLGVKTLDEVTPIETPKALAERSHENAAAAKRVLYYTCRFRQLWGGQGLRWTTDAVHKFFSPKLVTSTLVADHPYFSGTGLGMGLKTSNAAWGNYPLAFDWFDLARNHAVDMIGVEDWMGLQYMYGPKYTWEGFQLMGFQATIMRSGSQAKLPIISWITPSDETNLRLKSTSALAQGSKHFFYWTYGPTVFGTENYWSDLRGEYDGVAKIARQLAASQHITGPGAMRKTRVALAYSVSSDIWQPFRYVHMLERRATYLSLIHDQYLVDMLSEQDIESGRLKNYDVLLTTDACLTAKSADAISQWVNAGGFLYGACGAGSRNEFDEPVDGLAKVFGIDPTIKTTEQPGEYHIRCALNGLRYLDHIQLDQNTVTGEATKLGVLGVKVAFTPREAQVIGKFGDGSPAATLHTWGKGKALYIGACPGLSYIKDAKFVPMELKERWPAEQRRVINSLVAARGASRLVELSHPVVEAGVYDAPTGSALVLANFTYEPIDSLTIRVPVTRQVKTVRSVETGTLSHKTHPAPEALKAQGFPLVVEMQLKLGINDIVLLE